MGGGCIGMGAVSYHNSLVLIVPAAMRDAVLQIGRALGYEGGFTVELSADGSAPATHYGAHAWAADDFKALITGTWPTPDGIDPAVIAAAQAALHVSVQTPCTDPLGHFNATLAALGLQKVEA